MDAAWPALEKSALGGWTLRFSAGITQRANSVLPAATPNDVAAAVAEVETRSAARWLNSTFQISPAAQPADLDDYLAARGYTVGTPTLVQVMDGSELGRFADVRVDPRIEFSDEPSQEWLEVFWYQDGPAAPDDREVSRRILKGSPATYVGLRVDGRIESIARLAPVGEYAGIYCVTTRPEARRRGYSRLVMEAVLHEAYRRVLGGVWLQVRESNVGAIVLYNALGFSTASSYHYRTRSL
ncbi:GNAT family N-acetyltransferase [Arthrobacter sp.]|uniref:GNAT family N-acetyltransferase n=1 Tax=Arthrobacter sp. TaxID=1667 RepID=UPI003A8E6D9E